MRAFSLLGSPRCLSVPRIPVLFAAAHSGEHTANPTREGGFEMKKWVTASLSLLVVMGAFLATPAGALDITRYTVEIVGSASAGTGYYPVRVQVTTDIELHVCRTLGLELSVISGQFPTATGNTYNADNLPSSGRQVDATFGRVMTPHGRGWWLTLRCGRQGSTQGTNPSSFYHSTQDPPDTVLSRRGTFPESPLPQLIRPPVQQFPSR